MNNDFDYVVCVENEVLPIEPVTHSDAYVMEAYAKQLEQMKEEEE